MTLHQGGPHLQPQMKKKKKQLKGTVLVQFHSCKLLLFPNIVGSDIFMELQLEDNFILDLKVKDYYGPFSLRINIDN